MSLFRMCGFVAGFVFNYWIFGLAETHSREIFVGIAALYAIGFMLMCWRVREGEYAPVSETEVSTGGLIQAIRNYLRQSFGAPIYCWMYITRMFILSAGISATFSVFFARDQLGLNLDTIGKMAAWPSLLCLPLAYPFGILMDKWGSIRTLRLTLWITIATNTAGFLFVQGPWTLLAFGTLITSASFVSNIAQSVWLQKLFHHERLGQLSSASALVAALTGIFMGPLCGRFFGWVGDYRYIYVWPIIFTALALLGLSQVYRHWLHLGGASSYQPPLPGEPVHT
jgi:Na+/melibiose symporter-like transporter